MDTAYFGRMVLSGCRDVAARAVVAGVVSALLAAGTTVVAPTPAATAVAPVRGTQVRLYPAMETSTYEKRVQYWVNVKRRNHGRAKLRIASCTDRAAERWSSYLSVNDLFFHQSMSDLLERCDAVYAGETLGRGAIKPRRLVRMWMNSDGHRHVLLSRKARRIGIGAKPDVYGRWVVAADFMRF
jgi:uncharacterized protein YkwD